MPLRRKTTRRPIKGRKKTSTPYRKRTIGGTRTRRVGQVVRRMEENKITTLTLKRGIDQLFPDRFCVKLRNETAIAFTGAAGATNAFTILGNGLNSAQTNGFAAGANAMSVGTGVNITGLGNILSSDVINGSTGPYNQYRIHSSKMMWSVQNTSAANADSGCLIVVPLAINQWTHTSNVNAMVMENLSEYPYAKTQHIAGLTTNKGVRGSAAMSTARMYALKYKANLEDVVFTGTSGTNPSSLWYWNFIWFPDSSANTPINIMMKIEYWVEFFNRNSLAAVQG